MNSLDAMVARGVRSVLEEDLGPSTYRKVAEEMQSMYGVTMLKAAADFTKMDMVLRRFFGRHTTNIEAKAFGRVLAAAGRSDGDADVSILEPTVASDLLAAYGDPATKAILDAVRESPKSMPEIAAGLDVSKASAYGRARRLLQEGLLRDAGWRSASDGRRVAAYRSTISDILIQTRGDGLQVDARIPGEIARYSYAFNSVMS